MLKSDRWFKNNKDIFHPFEHGLNTENNTISYGVSSYGYDIRLAPEIELFSNAFNGIIDPKKFNKKNLLRLASDRLENSVFFILPPNSFSLGRSLEYIKVPRNCAALCIGKSTYARCGLVVNATPLEPEWEGHLTLEFSNTTNLPMKIYPFEGIAQLLFFEGEDCEVSYKDRKGKYQHQTGITHPKV